MLIQADARHIPLHDGSVQMVCTSPPYWGLRDYGLGERGIGLEATPSAYVEQIVIAFKEVRRVLREDGTVGLNLGDTWQAAKGQAHGVDPKQPARRHLRRARPNDNRIPGLKQKDLVGIHWRVALALQADGWVLRQEIIWSKGNAMPGIGETDLKAGTVA